MDCIVCGDTVYRRQRCRACYKSLQRKTFHCTYNMCTRPVFAATLCQYHYRQWQTKCMLCTRKIYCRSLCRYHYRSAKDFPIEKNCKKCTKKVYLDDLCLAHFKKQFSALCILVGCTRQAHRRGLCCRHYFRERRANLSIN